MRVEASATSLEVWPGAAATLTISVFNTAEVICGYTFELLGIDREWLHLDYDQLNLFPGDDGQITLTLTLPVDFPAGRRSLAVVVQSKLDAADHRVIDIDLDVQATLEARLELEPSSYLGGRTGVFGMVITNTGNSWTRMVPVAQEEEGKAAIALRPAEVDVPPGEQVTVTAEVIRRRPFLGSPATRIIAFRVDGVDDPPQAVGAFTQRPIIGRGLLSLFGLLTALTVFGFVLTNSLGSLVDRTKGNDELLASALDREEDQLALAAAAANPSSIDGTVVRESSSGLAPVGSVTVQLFAAGDGSQPVGAIATDEAGQYSFGPIVGGDYKLRVIGAGFVETWYPGAQSFDDAETIPLGTGETVEGIDISIQGQPGLISGTILAPDPSDVVISLIQIRDDVRVATVREVTTEGSGVFVLEDIPVNLNAAGQVEPYELVAVKEGFAEERRLVTVDEGTVQDAITIRLRTGDARVSGTITLDGAPAPDDELIEVVASTGGEEYSTVTFDGGRYIFRDLPSPALYSIAAARTGYATETRTRRVDAGGRLEGVDLDLSSDSRTIRGTVTDLRTSTAVGGALVTLTDGQETVRARTGSDGAYELRDLDPAATYTLTASSSGYRDLTRSCGPSARGCAAGGAAADFGLRQATTSVSGVVCNRELNAGGTTESISPLGGVTVQLSSATYEATTITANAAAAGLGTNDPYAGADCSISAADQAAGRLDGFYRFTDVPLGTYTITFFQEGGLPFTQVVSLPAPGPVHQTLLDTSTISVTVVDQDGLGVAGADVDVFTQGSFESNPDGPPTFSAVTGPSGDVLFNQVEAPEEYVVIVSYLRDGDEEAQVFSRSFPLRVGESKSETITVNR